MNSHQEVNDVLHVHYLYFRKVMKDKWKEKYRKLKEKYIELQENKEYNGRYTY